jgi:anti-sigma factor RsiW
MSEPSSLTEQERANLVAYLDGELEDEAARALETRLSLDPAARAEAEALRRTWELLDFLPQPAPSPSFTHRTVERLVPVRATATLRARRWRRWAVGIGWAAALLIAGWCGYAGYQRIAPHRPGDAELQRDLRLIENLPLYANVPDLAFVEDLDNPDLFGESGS